MRIHRSDPCPTPLSTIVRRFVPLTFIFTLMIALPQIASAVEKEYFVTERPGAGSFPLAVANVPVPLVVSPDDFSGVRKVAAMLQNDIADVTGISPLLDTTGKLTADTVVLIGTIGTSPLIDNLVKDGKLDVNGIAGQRETFVIEAIDSPMKGVSHALVIAGSDKRGTIYGMFELSAQIGVSPWNWWADVPSARKANLYVMPGRHSDGTPKVRYRGIFLNDEDPALGGWSKEFYGGMTHGAYEHIFELILRLKGNYIWPAMWEPRSFYEDDPMNAEIADELGIVVGTSHHEPLMRAHADWDTFGGGEWNYETNPEQLREFWTEGMERTKDYEKIVTVGMRGDGDMGMSRDTNIALLEGIIADQREIIEEITGRDAAEVPQLWALYKEVQDYYDQGMRVPDDVTLLLCDDNWGNIRKLPRPDAPERNGGYGIYYHVDYVGGPRNYKWLNVTQNERTWEQMHLAYEHGVDRIWILNVGDLKPMEFPISFWFDYAWNPDDWTLDDLPAYSRMWAAQQFGVEHADEIAGFMDAYTKYNARRTPELIDTSTYSLYNYQEAETVVGNYYDLAARARILYERLPNSQKDAYFQLVLHPIIASANFNDLYVSAALNNLYARQGRAATNTMAQRVRDLFEKDAEISDYYNHTLAEGKWNHFMDQTHIGYRSWQQPDENIMPRVTEIELPAAPDMGIAIDGSESWWPDANEEPVLPVFDPYNDQTSFIDVFNRSQAPFTYSISIGAPWIEVSPAFAGVDEQKRVAVNIDWSRAPRGDHTAPVTITGPGGRNVTVTVAITNPASPQPNEVRGFVEANGVVSIESEDFSRKVDSRQVRWEVIPNLGRTGSSVITLPVTHDPQAPGGASARLEYNMYLFTAGEVTVRAVFSPTIDFYNSDGFQYAISFDDETPQIKNIHEGQDRGGAWDASVRDQGLFISSEHTITGPGIHVLKFWAVDPAVVLQKIVVNTGGMQPSYLGPPESFHR